MILDKRNGIESDKSKDDANDVRSVETASKNQGSRFIDTARELGVDEDEATFEEKLARLGKHKPKKNDMPSETDSTYTVQREGRQRIPGYRNPQWIWAGQENLWL